ncbi:MAG: aminotransferase class III-fold pyridoxal phosphate-dependent enzyme [Candidatus Bathyarchaeia archaeon]
MTGVSPDRAYPKMVVIPPGPVARDVIQLGAQLLSKSAKHLYPLVIDSAKGCIVKDVDGNEFIDFTSASGVTSTGHGHPRVIEAIRAQLERSMSFGYCSAYSEKVAKLSELLTKIVPCIGNRNVCYCSSGSEAVETGIKIAAWHTRGHVYFSFLGSSHGRTLGALSLSSSSYIHKRFFPSIPNVVRLAYPYCYRCPFGQEYPGCGCLCIDMLSDYLEKVVPCEEVACIIFEPIQGEGCIVPPEGFFEKLVKLARANHLLLIDDEVLTGIGRTGRWFAIENWETLPDLVCVGSSLTSSLSAGAVVGRADVMNLEADTHYSTLGGNPLVCAAAIATIQTIREEHLLENAARQGHYILRRLREIAEKYPIVGDVRGKGLLLGVEFIKDSKLKEPDAEAARRVMLNSWRRGILFQTVGKSTLRLCPPLTITRDLIDSALFILESAIAEVSSELR